MVSWEKQIQTMEMQARQVHAEAADTGRDKHSWPSEASDGTAIAKGMTAVGRLRGSGMFLVEGTFEGAVEMAGSVIVTAAGVVKGPIRADTVCVAGRVEGEIFAKDQLRLEMTGDIHGDVVTASFLICDGGQLNGRCTMTRAGKEPTFLY